MKQPESIIIFAFAALGKGISGGDRIFIEFARRWSNSCPTKIFVWEEGLAMCRRERLTGDKLEISLTPVGSIAKLGFIATYIYRIFLGVLTGLSLKLAGNEYVYSASEFWMDSLPGFILKLRYPRIKWVASWYQTAPNPLKGFSEAKREKKYRLSAFLYWSVQLQIKVLISRFADFVLVNNEHEVRQFSRLNILDRVKVVYGAVNLDLIHQYLKSHKQKSTKYIGVFQGRFHPQKGVLELIDVWGKVSQKIPNAKLAMIGDGPLMKDVQDRISKLQLQSNIELFGFLHDGEKKYRIFNSSKIVLHPAFFDSGGMAAAEAMAFGLPGVAFDLKSYEDYYPKGMMKAPLGDLNKFAEYVLNLIGDQKLYRRISDEAVSMVEKDWSWDKRAKEVLTYLTNTPK